MITYVHLYVMYAVHLRPNNAVFMIIFIYFSSW